MKKKIRNAALAAFSMAAVLSAFTVKASDDLQTLQSDSQQAIANFKKADSSFQTYMNNAAGYAIFPNVGKGGFIVGGAHGNGLVYQGTNLIGQASMTQASVGAQVGGQSFSEIIFFETPAALDDFKAGKFEMSADTSAVAASEGASKTARYTQGVSVFTLPKKGLMAQASVGGQKFKYEPLNTNPSR